MKYQLETADQYRRNVYPNWQQDRMEIASVCMILRALKVESVLEIGTAEGGSAHMWKEELNLSRFITVDIDEDHTRKMRDAVLEKMQMHGVRISKVKGYSQNPEVVKEACSHGKVDCVFIDGGHSYDEVKLDWENYGPQATKAVVFHDICLPDVKRLWDSIEGQKLSLVESGRYGMGVLLK